MIHPFRAHISCIEKLGFSCCTIVFAYNPGLHRVANVGRRHDLHSAFVEDVENIAMHGGAALQMDLCMNLRNCHEDRA